MFFWLLSSVSFGSWDFGVVILCVCICDDGRLTSNSLIHIYIECVRVYVDMGGKGCSICYYAMCMWIKKAMFFFTTLQWLGFNLYTANKPHFKDLISCSLCRLKRTT